ncbi:alpha/beta fold hydrolase [Reyranella sp.]|uniref:alpha/beta fold hydrolase n=1 Tax=Reyranella sp. TaxID=1929291 RepID=UPI003782F320
MAQSPDSVQSTAKPTLVLLPGLLNTRRLFEHQIEALSDIVDCVVPELWHYDSVAAMAQAAIDSAPSRFALAGFSMGGYVAFEVMRRAGGRVDRLALIDTQASSDTPETTARRRGFIEQTRIGRFHGVQPSLLPRLLHPSHVSSKLITQPILEMAAEIGAAGFVRQQEAIMGRPDSRPLLVDIAVPTLVIVGRQDASIPLHRAEEMAADIATSRLVVLEECGHMSPLERPAEVSSALRLWLNGQP